MAFDESELTPAVDIDSIDLSGDRGDTLPEDKPVDRGDETELDDDAKEVLKDLGQDDTAKDKDESDEDEEGAEEKGDDQPRDEKGRFKEKGEARIPKSRFDEAVGKEREAREAAERRAAELERRLNESAASVQQAQQIETLEVEISGLEKKHADLLLDGEGEAAAKVMREIRMKERQIAAVEADTRANARITQTLEKERVDATIARLEADYPMLNPQSESFDEDLVDLVLAKQRTLMEREGLTPSQALERAARVVEKFATKPVEEVEDKKGLDKAKTTEDRKAKQVEKNLDTQRRQPASMKDSGIDSDKAGDKSLPDPTKMTYEEFEALPAATKAKLRGDML